jgi:lipopolysaccharide biosynthesis glycosyltransferase
MLKAYIGWDGRDAAAYEVCRHSLLRHASVDVQVIPLKDWQLRNGKNYWRPYKVDESGQRWDDRDGKPFSTDFSFTRFMLPILNERRDEWVLYGDPDQLWLGDIAELFELVDPEKAVMCVQHDHRPSERGKMGGLTQTVYRRKNWSSLMLINTAKCELLTPYRINNMTGSWLHGMDWIEDNKIGSLPEEWNWLDGWSAEDITPKLIHFTRGTPDLPGNENAKFADLWQAELAMIGNDVTRAL